MGLSDYNSILLRIRGCDAKNRWVTSAGFFSARATETLPNLILLDNGIKSAIQVSAEQLTATRPMSISLTDDTAAKIRGGE